MDYIYETLFDIIKFISETASTSGGVIGYDSRIEYDGKYAWLPRGHVTESYDLSGEVQLERYLDDAQRIKNKIWVFGKADKPFPYTQATDDGNDYSDHWTETYSSRIAQLVYEATSGENRIAVPYNKLSYFSVDDYGWVIGYNSIKEQFRVASINTDSELATGDAASGQKIVDVVDGSTFSAGDIVRIYDDLASEYNKIASISTNQLTMVTNLANSYTTANNLAVAQNYFGLESNLVNTYTTALNSIIFLTSDSSLKLWGYEPTTGAWDDISAAGLSAVQKLEGSYSSLFQHTTGGYDIDAFIMFEEGNEISAEEYRELRGAFYFNTTAPSSIIMRLWSGDATANEVATARIKEALSVGIWIPFSLNIGSDNTAIWDVGSSFDWEDIQGAEIQVIYATSSTHSFYLDRFHFYGKRWGGGSSHAAIDGFAEDSTSQSTYGIREHALFNDLLLSDAECESKALSLLNFYKDARTTIELYSSTLDYGDYPMLPGNKVAINMTPIGISGNYRIDAIELLLSAEDHTLEMTFVIDTTPPRLADYIYSLTKSIKDLERGY